MDALVMCGGRGTRLAAETEKPLYEIAGRPMIDRVLEAVADSDAGTVHAAVSPQTPETRSYLDRNPPIERESLRIIETAGEGYVADLREALDAVSGPVLTLAADLPLLEGDAIDTVLDSYTGGALAVCVPDSLKGTIGVSSETTMEYDGQEVASTGVNVVREMEASETEEQNDRIYLTHDVRFAVNVNYQEDARVAAALLGEGVDRSRSTAAVETARRVGREPHGSSDDPELLDFSANTNPRVPAGVESVYGDAFEQTRRYPAEPPETYCEAAAAYVGCEPAQVIPTPGGLAAIRRTVELAVSAGDSALVPAPSFGEYARELRLQGATPVFVSQEDILDANPTGHALAVVCNPNNPTGNAYDREKLLAFVDRCREAGTVLLVDEAFLGFTDRESLAGTEGVVVARSLTKLFGMPGLRAGFAVATGAFRDALRASRRTWNVSVPALETGTYCFDQTEFVRTTRERVATERARLRSDLEQRFDVAPSDAPFLLVDVGDRSVETLLQRARDRGVVCRDGTTFRGLDSHIRVAVRLPEENDRLLEVLADV